MIYAESFVQQRDMNVYVLIPILTVITVRIEMDTGAVGPIGVVVLQIAIAPGIEDENARIQNRWAKVKSVKDQKVKLKAVRKHTQTVQAYFTYHLNKPP